VKNLLDSLIADYTVLQAVPEPVVYVVFMIIFAFVVAGVPLSLYSGLLTYAERRVAGKIQSRVGPNRVGPQGLFQFIADGVKLIEKEDIISAEADSLLFRIAPYLVFLGCMLTYVVLPFGDGLIVSDLNIGIFYALAVSSIVVIGILMAGWASNNKWSLLGGMRSAAHMVSYEIPSGIALIAVVLVAGSLSTQSIIEGQGWDFANWNIFHNPFTFIAFFIYFAAAMAEINRAPFDFPEAESELVSGYNTEYSGMRFAIFFLAEFANIYVISAIAVTVFLGGWHTPSWPGQRAAQPVRGRELLRKVGRAHVHHSLAALDAAALAHRPADGPVLEVSGAHGHVLPVRRGDLDGPVRHPQLGRPAGPLVHRRRGSAGLFLPAVRMLVPLPLGNGARLAGRRRAAAPLQLLVGAAVLKSAVSVN